MAVFCTPLMFIGNVKTPTATLLKPSMLSCSALLPKDVLKLPVVFVEPALVPMKTLLNPVVSALPAFEPNTVLFVPVGATVAAEVLPMMVLPAALGFCSSMPPLVVNRARRRLFVRTSNAMLSVVPMKLVPATVPALPVVFQPDVLLASVSQLVPSLNWMLVPSQRKPPAPAIGAVSPVLPMRASPFTCNRVVGAATVPMPTLAPSMFNQLSSIRIKRASLSSFSALAKSIWLKPPGDVNWSW
jgi:hypothetical protein